MKDGGWTGGTVEKVEGERPNEGALSLILHPSSFILRFSSFVFLALLAIPFFVALDDSSVWDANEAFYVETPREMLERGDWLIPHFNGEPRLNKPPLSYWLVGAFYQMFGVSLFWERLLLAVLGFGSVVLVYLTGRRLYDSDTALLAAAILATTFRLLMLSRRLLIDILMLFCLLAVLFFFVEWLKRRRPDGLVWASVFLGLAFLTKGPVVLIAPLVLIVYAALDRRSRPVIKGRDLVLPALLFLMVSSSWFVALGARLGWQPVADFLLQENLGRFSHLDYGPSRGPLYYLQVFVVDFFPWSLFFLAALIGCLKAEARKGWKDPLLLWVFAFLVFFSFSHNKQEYYILPAYPAAALWLASRLSRRPPPNWLGAAAGVLLLAAIAAICFYASRVFPPSLAWWIPLLPALVLPPALGTRYLRTAALAFACFYALAFFLYLPAFERYKPVPGFARTIQREAAAKGGDVEAGYFNFTAPSLAYYLRTPIFEVYSFEDAIDRLHSSKMVYMVVQAEDYSCLCARLGVPVRIVETRPKLYTTARLFLEGIKGGGSGGTPWIRPVHLVTNEGIPAPVSEYRRRESGPWPSR